MDWDRSRAIAVDRMAAVADTFECTATEESNNTGPAEVIWPPMMEGRWPERSDEEDRILYGETIILERGISLLIPVIIVQGSAETT